MNPIEFVVSLLAPHQCVVCKREGPYICPVCAKMSFHAPTKVNLAALTSVNNIYVGANYAGVAKDIVHALKFQRAKSAADAIAGYLSDVLPPLPPNVVVSAVPTANARVRARGYDQARLIAKSFVRLRSLKYSETLIRLSGTRQVGSNRRDRFRHLQCSFKITNPKYIAGKHILLIDDVLTTGATLQAAAKKLHFGGAVEVDAAVFAYSELKESLPVVPKVIQDGASNGKIPNNQYVGMMPLSKGDDLLQAVRRSKMP